MCVNCYNSNFVCSTCGTIVNEDWKNLVPYFCLRKSLKRLKDTSDSENFVWFLRLDDRIMKIGFGSLHKLWRETLPSPYYTRFDSVFIYWCKSEEERNIFATFAMGNIEGIVNKKAVPNTKYVGKTELRFKSVVPGDMRDYVMRDPDLIIGDSKYWDIDKLREAGYVL